MPIAPDVNDPEYWDQRAKESGQADAALGRGGVRQVCYQGGYVLHLPACRQSHHRLLMLRQCCLLALANSLVRFQGWALLH